MPCGRVSVLAYAAFPQILDAQHTEASVRALLQSQGELASFQRQPNGYGPSIYTASAQYAIADNACRAVAAFDGRSINVRPFISNTRDDASADEDMSQGAVVHLALVQMGSGGGLSAPTDPISPGPMPSQSIKDLDISGHVMSAHVVSPQEDLGLGIGAHFPAVPFQVQQPLAMWPVMCQTPLQSSLTFTLDNHQHPSHIPPSPLGNYQLVSPASSHPGQRAHYLDGHYQPRSMPSLVHHEPRRQHASRVSRSSFYSMASHHNHVDVARIREGIDVRTTVYEPFERPGIFVL